MTAADLWQTTFIAVAAAAGYWVAAQNWAWAHLIAFPAAYLLVTWTSRRSGRDVGTTASEHALQARLIEVEAAAEVAAVQAERASAAVVKAAEHAVQSEEDARALLVADLHDSPAQTLVALRYLGTDPTVTVAEITELATRAELQLRDVMRYQRPLDVAGKSLAEMIFSLVEDIGHHWDVAVEVTWPEEPVVFSYPTVVVLYRFTAEALMNVAKHSRSRDADLRFEIHEAEAVVAVRDYGVGFDVSDLERTDRLGLAMTRHRAETIGGIVSLTSRPGEGTRIELHIPRSSAL